MMNLKDCPFCQTTIADAVFARSENFLAVYNVAPILPGHTLIIPRNHIESVMDLDEEEMTEMMRFTRKVTTFLMEVFRAEAFNWSVQDKEIAGQSVAHLHLHIVLRYPGDFPDPGDWYPQVRHNYEEILDSESRLKLEPDELEKIVQKLRLESERKNYF